MLYFSLISQAYSLMLHLLLLLSLCLFMSNSSCFLSGLQVSERSSMNFQLHYIPSFSQFSLPHIKFIIIVRCLYFQFYSKSCKEWIPCVLCFLLNSQNIAQCMAHCRYQNFHPMSQLSQHLLCYRSLPILQSSLYISVYYGMSQF